MSKADELLRRLFNEAFMAETIEECRAYLNEKPHEPTPTMPMYPSGYAERLREASPPHAAAELGAMEPCPHFKWTRKRDCPECTAAEPVGQPNENGLLPCPFCGGTNIGFGRTEDGGEFVTCDRCGATGNLRYPLKEPVEPLLREWWNARASPSAQPIAREPRVRITAEIADERERQVSIEDWSPAHDDEHDEGVLAAAAASYALSGAAHSAHPAWKIEYTKHARAVWPFDDEFAKPKDARRDLIRAGALIVAEIERLDRAALKSAGKEST